MSRAAAAIFAALAAIFWLGRSQSFGPGDSAQHALAGLVWGVPHPPGYPLEVFLSWLWARLPWDNPSAAVNGLSGLFAAGAAACFFLLLRRLGNRPTAALTGTALMALAPLFWYYSLVAEARALNNLLAVSTALLAVKWADKGDSRLLWAACLLGGLGLSHHPSFLFIVPSLVIFASARIPKKPVILKAAVLVLVGIAVPYLILGLRLAHSAPAYNPYAVNGWSDLWALFTRKNYGGPLRMVSGSGFLGFGAFDGGRLVEHAGWFVSSVWTHAGPAGLLLGALGAAELWKKDRRTLAAWAAWLLLGAGAFIAVSSQQLTVCDPEYARAVLARHYLLPLIGLFGLAGAGAELLARRARPAFAAALAAAVVALPLGLRPLSLAADNPSRDYARGLIRDSAPGDLVLLTSDDSIFAVLHLDLISGEGRDRVFLTPSLFSYAPYIRSLAKAHPELKLPPAGPQGLPTDWEFWKKLNPGRKVLAEPTLREAMLRLYPGSAPQGSLIRVSAEPFKDDPAATALRFLDAPETASWTRAKAREWTQEVYVLEARKLQAEWIGSRLDPRKDQDSIRRLIVLMNDL